MAVAIIGLAFTMAACSSGGGPAEPVAEPSSQAPTTATSPYRTSGDGQVVVAEKGFSMIASHNDLPRLSYGVVLENRNRKAVAFPAYTVSFIDAAGTRIGDDVVTTSPPRILPGGRYGVGGTIPQAAARKVADLRLTVTETTWVPTNAEGRFTGLVASQVRTQQATRPADGGRTTLTFTIDSAFAKPIPGVDASVVFRDGAGRIIGGVDHVTSRADFDGVDVPPGRSDHELTLKEDAPAGVDESRTEVYVFPNSWPAP
ncbi:hypothetical protein [Actinomadura sp. 9N215]|uniref:hypothetical protein n=1 Tax=Actinomadura sp. 9N215 TaxID=3375150 RepID=UPI00378D5811